MGSAYCERLFDGALSPEDLQARFRATSRYTVLRQARAGFIKATALLKKREEAWSTLRARLLPTVFTTREISTGEKWYVGDWAAA